MSKEAKRCDQILKKVAILLISEHQEDYNALKAFGFKRVDFFKSEICAFNYFEQNNEALEKYNVVLFGPQTAREVTPLYNFKLSWMFGKHVKTSSVTFMQLVRSFSVFGTPTYSILYKASDEREMPEFNNYEELFLYFCQILESLNVLEKALIDAENWQPLNIDVQGINEWFPNSVKKIKVLYLGAEASCSEGFSSSVTYIQDDASYDKDELLRSLGKYDIIIAPRKHFKELAHLGVEASEQCIYTGRKLVLLVTYQITDVYSDLEHSKFGENIKLRYTYGTPGLPKLEPQDISFNILKKTTTVILQKCMLLYAELMKKHCGYLMDVSAFSDWEKYPNAFEEKLQEASKNIVDVEEIFNNFKDVQLTAEAYLGCKAKSKHRFTHLEEIEVCFDGRSDIAVQIYESERLIGSLIFPRFSKRKKVINFAMQYLYDNAKLSVPVKRSLYISKPQNATNLYESPSTYELIRLSASLKRVLAEISSAITK